MIEHTHGNLLDADVEALVNTVNTVGVMGKGIALQFRQAYPANFSAYQSACKRGDVVPGQMFVVPTGQLTNPRYIINFPTKRHWRGKAQMEDIDTGLAALIATIRAHQIGSIAVPPLGCGNGGLSWDAVRPKIEAAFAELPDVRVLLYAPDGSPDPETIRVATKRPSMTLVRAAILGLIEQYAPRGYRVTMLEIQKLAYFLESAGEPLKLEFEKARYGPYSEKLHHVLQRIDGHFVRGYGDRTQEISLHPLPDAIEEAQAVLDAYPETQVRLSRVGDLIEGYETPYGVELLSSVHWVAQESPAARQDAHRAAEEVHAWNERKRQFRADHITLAWGQLHAQQWI
ncbi:macro domain-containing protein [Chloroflexales bacterium ZM16-3]|nr:macro domain-containing protein [Chloroflexales bacterium ZM16-3]